jgi:hypothetical protein
MLAETRTSHRERQGRALRNRNRPRKKIPVRPPLPSDAEGAAKLSSPEAAGEKRKPSWLVWLLVLVQAALLGAVIWLIRLPQPELPSDPDRRSMEVRWQVAGQEDRVESVYYGEQVVLPESVDAEGYTFLGWLDADGRLEEHRSIPVYRDMVFTAKLLPAFETEKHIPYLETDAEAVLDVDGPITMREFVNILYLLLNTEETGSGSFVDVPEDDPCFKAAAYLKDIGILSGTRLHPDANLSCGELLEILCRFFPTVDAQDFTFQDLDADSPYYPYFCTAAAKGWIPSG